MTDQRQAPSRAPRARAGMTAATAFGVIAVMLAGCSKPPSPSRPPPGQPSGGTRQLTIWLTGYSWQDNTPPGADIGEPVIHQAAGGQGTFTDPITVATPGHKNNQAWKPGTKFYLPSVRRYAIVEDSGAAPEPAGTDTHLDMWIDGRGATKSVTDACETQFTGRDPAQVNPPDGLPVMAGPIYANNTCNVPPQSHDMGTYKDSEDGGDDSEDGGHGGGGNHSHHHSHHSDDDND